MFVKDELQVGRFLVPTAVVGDTGPFIVGVNGAQQTMASWRSFVRHFSSRGFRVVLFDLPGQGRGRVLEGPPGLDLGEQVTVTAAVMDAVSPQAPVDLIGGSWGAVVCAATAATHPDRVRQMILGSFRTAANPRLLEMARRGRRYIEDGQLERLSDLFVDGFGGGLPETKKAEIRRQMSRLPREQAEHLLALSLLFADGHDISRHVDLGRIRARTLILNGAADPIVDPENLHLAVRRIPGCTGYLVPGLGHFLHQECPALLTTYEAFFRGVRFLAPFGPEDVGRATEAWEDAGMVVGG